MTKFLRLLRFRFPRTASDAVIHIALAVLVVSTLLITAACGSGGDSGSSAPDAPRAGGTLRIYGFGQGDDVAQTRAALATNALKPAKVANPPGAYDDQRFLTLVAAGRVPDVIYLDRQKVASLAAKGVIEPLDACVDQQAVDLSQYRKAALDEVTWEGKLYALPEFTNQRVVIVNEAAVRNAGIRPSDIQTTDWSALETTAKRLTKGSGRSLARIGFDPKIPEFFVLWARANGAELLSDDGLHAHLDDPKAVEALAFTKSLIDAQGGWDAFKAFRDTWDFFGKDNPVRAGQIGAWPMESWYWNVLAENSPNVDVRAVAFTDRNGRPITFFTGNGWAIPRGAKHPDLACRWMKAMTSVDAWMAAARNRAATAKNAGYPFTGLYTANKTADERILDEVYESVSPNFDAAVKLLVEVQGYAFAFPPSPAGVRFQQALTDAINRVLTGAQTPKEALEQAQNEAQSAIDRAG
jgi:multiple sugar transport system substrate-binding protein